MEPEADLLLDLSFGAQQNNAELAVHKLRQALEAAGLGALVFDLELLAREALSNAVRHGCAGDAACRVRMRLESLPQAVRLRVDDPGQGFDWRAHDVAAPDPQQESGRGLSILHAYADMVDYNDAGNSLTLVKRHTLGGAAMAVSTDTSALHVLGARLAAVDVPGLRERFKELLAQGVRELTLDCSALESLDSVGIGLLVATHNSLAKAGGRLLLTNVAKPVYQLLTLMRLEKHITIAAPAAGGGQ